MVVVVGSVVVVVVTLVVSVVTAAVVATSPSVSGVVISEVVVGAMVVAGVGGWNSQTNWYQIRQSTSPQKSYFGKSEAPYNLAYRHI